MSRAGVTKSMALTAAALLAVTAPMLAQRPDSPGRQVQTRTPAVSERITAREIDADVRFLASDLLEGRAPGTRGGQITEQYIASQLMAAGVRPAGENGTWFQKVPIDVVSTDASSVAVRTSGKADAQLRFPDDVVVWAGSAQQQSAVSSEIVFVGYGTSAPEYQWDDFKGLDVRNKILLVLVNDPPAPATQPELFGGRAMTYYGRWTYKFEEAERQGAAGMLVIHNTERAGYPWSVVTGSNAREHRMLPRAADAPAPLAVRGWIKDTVAVSLLQRAGLNFEQLREQAGTREFRPVPTGILMDVSLRSSVASLHSSNVVGVVQGSDAALRGEYVAYSAHWDHLGIGPAVKGDSIYNGALDNASGVADVLAIARAAARVPPPRRSLLFVFVTAEESGLLGSAFFGQNPTVPAGSIIANVNIDGGNLLGRVRDVRVLGDTKSSLGPALAEHLRPMGIRISPEAHPERGGFYRSDHFSFAKVGIPSVSIGAGQEYVGRPVEWGEQQGEAYTAQRYHQPSDEYRSDFDLSGAVQLSEIALSFGTRLADAPGRPTWNADAEFGRK
jgi:Zn-dependent M28 family amino/carboxypeptidase